MTTSESLAKPETRAPPTRAITERKRAEEALRESEERYQLLYTQTPAMLHSIDSSGRILAVSDDWLKVLGYERNEVIGQRSVEFLTAESRRYAEAVTLPEFWKSGSARDVSYQFVKKNGDIIDVLLSAVAERDADGNIRRSLAVLTDVTEQKRTEEALRFTQFAIDRSGGAASWMDSDGRFFYVNDSACHLLGYTREELLSMTVHDIDLEHPPEVWPETWRAIRERRSYTIESRLCRKDGMIVPVAITVNYLEFDGKEYNCSFVRDITEHVRLEEALQRAREELEGKVERQIARRNQYRLTFREFTILHLVAAGKADKEIARELAISPLTAHKHVANILAKMDAASRTEAGVRAVREGLLD